MRKLLGELEHLTGRRITLREVCAQSGCDKNALSRMLNHPDVVPSAKVIDELVQYFFRSFKVLDPRKREDLLMREIISKFIAVYPSDFSLSELAPSQEEEEAFRNMGVEAKWQYYNHLKYGSSPELEAYYGNKSVVIGGGPSWSGPSRSASRSSSDKNKASKRPKKKS